MASYWNIHKLYNCVISDRDTCLQWCEEQGLLPIRRLCLEGHEMFMVQSKTSFGQFRCSKKHHTGKAITLSRTRGTVFEGKKLSPEKVLIMIYCFVHDLTYCDCITESSIDGGVTSKETVCEFYSFFRELITQHYLEIRKCSQIGGKDKAVEILEFCLGRRKFNIGPYAEGTCIVVMIECNSKCFSVEVCNENGWNTENLLPLIRKNVIKQSIIMHNENRDFSFLSDDDYIIQSSKDCSIISMEPVCMDSCSNFSTEESFQHKNFGADKLLEFLYKYDVKMNNLDPFEAFLDIIRHRFPVC